MRNLFLDPYAASDIDRFVAKVLADLGEPDPPVRLIDVRELLRLDKSFYSSTDDSATREVVHKLKVAGQQVLARPSILKDVIGKLGLKALLLPDRRRILIDSEIPDLKQTMERGARNRPRSDPVARRYHARRQSVHLDPVLSSAD